MYQDAFEAVNPLGSARNIHKVVAVYLALANLPFHIHTCIDNLQLVLLCCEIDIKYFGQQKVFEKLLHDLMHLEANGFQMNGDKWDVRLISVLGDNLGSHWLGGFCTNFSTSQYICHCCIVHKDKDGLSTAVGPRTPESYDAALTLVSNDSAFQGINRQSVLNALKFYHVCMPGLPPCLGHDLFEGIIQYDLSLILKILCKKNHMVCLMSI